MFIEMLNELLNDASGFYFYIGLIWAASGAINVISINHPVVFKHRFHIKSTMSLQYKDGMIEAPFTENMNIQTMLTPIFKRIDAPDNDSDDYHASSRTNPFTNIRGGQKWKKHLYSRSLKSMV